MAEKKKSHTGRNIGITITLMIAVLIGITVAYTLMTENVYNGVTLGNVDMSGKTYEQVSAEVQAFADDILANGSFNIKVAGDDFITPVNQIIGGIDVEKTAQAVYNYAREGDVFTRCIQAMSALFGGHNVETVLLETNVEEKANELLGEIPSDATALSYGIEGNVLVLTQSGKGYDFNRVDAKEDIMEKISTVNFSNLEIEAGIIEPQDINVSPEQIKADVDKTPQEAMLVLSEDRKSYTDITPEQVGISVEIADIEKALAEGRKDVYHIPVTVTQPTATVENLKQSMFTHELGSASTKFSVSNKNRTYNIGLTVAATNGIILNPGDEFSYNDIVGPRTYAAGYKDATVYVNNQPETGVAGGICQTSSTLYMATLHSDLLVTERRNHSLPVAYTPLGQDATVVYGATDYKFSNDTPFPVKVSVVIDGGTLTVSMLGTKTTDKTVQVKSWTTSSTPYETITNENATLAPGQTEVITKGYTGYKVKTVKYVTENGVTTEEVMPQSSYAKVNQVLEVGPQPVVAPVVPPVDETVTPTDPSAPPTTENPPVVVNPIPTDPEEQSEQPTPTPEEQPTTEIENVA